MYNEIEVKFADIIIDDIRAKLTQLGAQCEQPMRLMKRVAIHTPEMIQNEAYIRIRDEGHRTTVTYKQFNGTDVDSAYEYETTVGDFDTAVNIFRAGGLPYDAYQESRRENWKLGDTEIMIDEWPWLRPYIEIEGKSEVELKDCAETLGFDWADAIFGGVANLYVHQYPHIGDAGIEAVNHGWDHFCFDDPAPEMLKS